MKTIGNLLTGTIQLVLIAVIFAWLMQGVTETHRVNAERLVEQAALQKGS